MPQILIIISKEQKNFIDKVIDQIQYSEGKNIKRSECYKKFFLDGAVASNHEQAEECNDNGPSHDEIIEFANTFEIDIEKAENFYEEIVIKRSNHDCKGRPVTDWKTYLKNWGNYKPPVGYQNATSK